MNPAAYTEMSEIEERHWWFTGRRAILESTIRALNLPLRAKILEVGCGTGGNIPMLSKYGTVSGFEMDETACAIGAKKAGGKAVIKAGSCPDDIPFPGETFDLVCMFDVLEHIAHDVETLAALKNHLAEDGRMIITVPAHQWLWGPHDEFLHHKRRYSTGELRSKVAVSGFDIVKLSYINFFLAPPAVLVRLKDKLFGSKQGTGGKVPPQPVNALFHVLFSAERVLLRFCNLPWGISFLCVLKKNVV